MYRTIPESVNHSATSPLALSFREAENWDDTLGSKGLTLLMGDKEAGPFVFFTTSPPTEDEMSRGPAHGHDSDNWRISIQGTTNMGKYAYTQSQFRFQDGGIPYPDDNVTWGPEGGYGIVIFADRRGWPVRLVDSKLAQQYEASLKSASESMGIDTLHPCPGAPAIRTTLGETKHGHLDSGFESAASWPEIAPGSRAVVSVLGEHTVGPVLVLLHSDPGALVVPAGTLDSDTLHVVVDGSCVVNGETKTLGDFWVTVAGQQAEVVAGPNGLSHVLFIGNRKAVAGFDVSNSARSWADNLRGITSDLIAQL